MKKKFTGPNQPVRKLNENGLPGKHRDTCLHGVELYLWEAESGEQHYHKPKKEISPKYVGWGPNPSQRAGEAGWVSGANTATLHWQHSTSDRAVMPWVNPAPKKCTEGLCISCGQLPCEHALQPQLCHKLHKGSLARETEREVPIVNPIPSICPMNT